MSSQADLNLDFEREVSAALLRAAELAREEAIKTNTGIVVSQDGKVITITAEQLRQKSRSSAK
jgi:acyl-homoserine lactone acylase PvdQ